MEHSCLENSNTCKDVRQSISQIKNNIYTRVPTNIYIALPVAPANAEHFRPVNVQVIPSNHDVPLFLPAVVLFFRLFAHLGYAIV